MRLTTFLTITILIALVMFVALMSSSRVYTTQTLLLVLPKSEVSAVQAEHVIGNITALSAYKHFANGKFPYSLDGTWNGTVDVARKEGTGIIALRATAGSAKDASVINKAMTQSALKRISNYYNIAKDVDVRIVGEPTHTRTRGHIFPPVILSILAGVLIAAIITGVAKVISIFASRAPRTQYQPQKSWKTQTYEDVVASRPAYEFDGQEEYMKNKAKDELAKVGVHDLNVDGDDPEDLFEQHAHRIQENIEEDTHRTIEDDIASARSSQRGAAPSNLPIIDVSDAESPAESAEELIEQIAEQEHAREEAIVEKIHDADGDENSDDSDVTPPQMPAGEPTDEELKERLNKLLRGDL